MKRYIRWDWVIGACAALWALSLPILINANFVATNGLIFGISLVALLMAASCTLILAITAVVRLRARNPESENYTHSPIAKTLALLLVVTIVLSTYAAVKSLYFNPMSDNFSDRFVYENLATIVGFGGIVLTCILSAVQKDIYWVTRRKMIKLDERQIQERQRVFETSYKFGVIIIFISVVQLCGTADNLPTILANNNQQVPGHLYWIGINLVVALLALPLLVAAYKKR